MRSPLHPISLSSCRIFRGLACGFLIAFSTAHGAEPADAKPATPIPATKESIEAAMKRGVDFLVKTQNANGSWGSATRTKGLNIYAPIPGAHHAYRAGASGLALSGILESGDSRPEVAACIDKAAKWTMEELPHLRRADPTSTYNSWGHAYGLRAISRLYRRETDPGKQAEWVKLAQEQVELAGRYEDVNGGWGYLDMDELITQKPSGIPTSFTTATVLLAMAEARDVMGVKLDDKLVRHALHSIELQRTPDFAYTYSFQHHMYPRKSINRPAGSLSRSQVCNACLRKFGDEKITDEVLVTWADRFIAREGFISNGRKRPVPHEAPFKIAGYFYYYGIYYFTVAADMLPKERKAKYARQLAGLILEKQEKDGSWWDYPLYDYHQAYGTGYALLALDWCRDVLSAQ